MNGLLQCGNVSGGEGGRQGGVSGSVKAETTQQFTARSIDHGKDRERFAKQEEFN